eukprot:scaffold28182_cov126-Isochrysis_galbana.AAC.4
MHGSESTSLSARTGMSCKESNHGAGRPHPTPKRRTAIARNQPPPSRLPPSQLQAGLNLMLRADIRGTIEVSCTAGLSQPLSALVRRRTRCASFGSGTGRRPVPGLRPKLGPPLAGRARGSRSPLRSLPWCPAWLSPTVATCGGCSSQPGVSPPTASPQAVSHCNMNPAHPRPPITMAVPAPISR